jgi:hypothetical protein
MTATATRVYMLVLYRGFVSSRRVLVSLLPDPIRGEQSARGVRDTTVIFFFFCTFKEPRNSLAFLRLVQTTP